jgi:hypothetical protein
VAGDARERWRMEERVEMRGAEVGDGPVWVSENLHKMIGRGYRLLRRLQIFGSNELLYLHGKDH